ncbi:hypothetical protein [Castellaniella sp.]|uniref:hypothetical protein n=1 Tax=Castellaniella sp. TaxID=1955812 RepID=UPI002AFEC4C6|nr:hypothetical protein [Castellaniella sp.]
MIKGFRAVKRMVIAALQSGAFQHEVRSQIDLKNLLQCGEISAAEVEALIRRSTGTEHACSPHHQVPEIDVHVIKTQGWYIKFYFVGDPDTLFISVHHVHKP